MVKIMSDSSTLYSVAEGKRAGVDIVPLSVQAGDRSYRELEEIDTPSFLQLIQDGHMPTSSQPGVGETMEHYRQCGEDEILNITMADGLSGTYSSACCARENVENAERIHVWDSRTLCGPQRHLVNCAAALAKQGRTARQILQVLEEKAARCKSFLIPQDFGFLKRGGRLTPLAAAMGGLLKLVPVMTQTKDCKRLEKFTLKRTFSKAVASVLDEFEKLGMIRGYKFYITHGCAPERAEAARRQILARWPGAEVELYLLTPAFLTQGGPQCVAIQGILA